MPIDPTQVRAILFDVDGTLRNTDDEMVASVWRALRFTPLPNKEKVARRVVMALESPANAAYASLDRLGLDAPLNKVISRLHRTRLGNMPKKFWMVPGVGTLLDQLRPQYKLGIVTARDEDHVNAFLFWARFPVQFDVVANAFTCQHTKPFPDPVLWCAKNLGVQPAHCLMIGDSGVDMRAGKTAGAQTVGVLCGFGTRAELERNGADAIIASTPDVVRLLGT